MHSMLMINSEMVGVSVRVPALTPHGLRADRAADFAVLIQGGVNVDKVAPTDQIGTIVKMLEQQQKPQAAKVLLKSAGRLFLVDQKDICYASIEDGIITQEEFDEKKSSLLEDE